MFVIWLSHFKGLLRPLPVGSEPDKEEEEEMDAQLSASATLC